MKFFPTIISPRKKNNSPKLEHVNSKKEAQKSDQTMLAESPRDLTSEDDLLECIFTLEQTSSRRDLEKRNFTREQIADLTTTQITAALSLDLTYTQAKKITDPIHLTALNLGIPIDYIKKENLSAIIQELSKGMSIEEVMANEEAMAIKNEEAESFIIQKSSP